MKKISILLLASVLFVSYATYAQRINVTAEEAETLVDPASIPSRQLSFYAYPQKNTLKVEFRSFLGKEVTVMLQGPSGKMLGYKKLDNCDEFTHTEFKLPRRSKGIYTVKVVTSKLKQMTQLIVLEG